MLQSHLFSVFLEDFRKLIWFHQNNLGGVNEAWRKLQGLTEFKLFGPRAILPLICGAN